ncbi:hypothetical protein AGMMS49938_16080 [Fibrobacterales bacterium]|nr:hypothetical protein AGMMS49938_16080 [Fibrobacterales bacterium]
MNRLFCYFLASANLMLIFSCAATSAKQENALTLYEEYKSASQYFAESESNYLTLLSNLERYPKDEYLLIQKQLLRKEVEQNRVLMLQARSEYEAAVQDWDIAIQKMETGLPPDSIDIRQIFGLPRPETPQREE